MRITLTNPITGKERTQSAHLTTEHSASSYGQPVLVVGGEALDAANVALQKARIIELPRRKDQVEMLKKWLQAAGAIYGQ